jgi:hypothetical protein
MQDIDRFRSRGARSRVASLMKKISQLNIDGSEYENYTHAVAGILVRRYGMSERIVVLQTSIDFAVVFDRPHPTVAALYQKFDGMTAGWYTDEGGYEEDYFMNKVARELEQGKMVFVFLDLHNYIPHDDDVITAAEKYETHATGLLLYPVGDQEYAAYHFNPHGQRGAYTNAYTKCTSVRRRHDVVLDTGLDRYVVRALIGSLNKHLLAWTSAPAYITYTRAKAHNYVGPNLQAGDQYGVCYVFPTIFLLEICKNYDVTYAIEYKELDERTNNFVTRTQSYATVAQLLRQRKATHIVWFAVATYLPEARQLVPPLEEIPGPHTGDAGTTLSEMHHFAVLEDIIEEKGTFFIKGIMGALVLYLTQKPLREEVERRVTSQS